ncbi:Transposase, Mutator family [Parageobacillus caldoxylosilyticus]|nr:Transposase, Mutator family [Parageobacillus caldoxylosilyticus]
MNPNIPEKGEPYLCLKYTECRLGKSTGKCHSSVCKGKLELIMREEIKNFLEIEQAGTSNMRNGYYQRNLDTQYGRIEGLWSLETETENFKRSCLPLTKRHTGWLEEAIIRMYQSGMSTREIGKFIERILGNAYSPATISRITDVVKEDIENGTLVHCTSVILSYIWMVYT